MVISPKVDLEPAGQVGIKKACPHQQRTDRIGRQRRLRRFSIITSTNSFFCRGRAKNTDSGVAV